MCLVLLIVKKILYNFMSFLQEFEIWCGEPVQVKVPIGHERTYSNLFVRLLPRACPSDTNFRAVTSTAVFISEVIYPSSDFTVYLMFVGGFTNTCEESETSCSIYIITYFAGQLHMSHANSTALYDLTSSTYRCFLIYAERGSQEKLNW
jgi:hypothetical protein